MNKAKNKFFIKSDQKRLQQVLLNLLSNAIKFSNINSTVDINIEYLNDDHIKVSVVDRGKGIKQKDRPKMFKLFNSFKDEKKKVNVDGIGLGLVISRMIVEKFNGEIDYTSIYKEGTTFFFTFEHEPYKFIETNTNLQKRMTT